MDRAHRNSLTSLSCVELAAAIRERRTAASRRWRRCSSAPRGAAAPQLLPAHRRRTPRWPPRISPTATSRAATCAARCTACRWRTRTCTTAAAWSRLAARRSCATRPRRRRRRCSSTWTPPARSSSACSTWRSSPWGRPATTGTTATAAIPGIPSASPAARRRVRAPRWRPAPTSPRSAPIPAARRLPSAFCGLAGIRPTHGRVSVENILPLCPSLDTVGPLTRTVEDAALILEVIAPGLSPSWKNRSRGCGSAERSTKAAMRRSPPPWMRRSKFFAGWARRWSTWICLISRG